ncbi:aldehyde dehydrogenase [Candidatus Woesearchaeota archaeon]|nr:aldehyde dehydrogenase [Candidatus Woesearchaeota archaeon]MDP6740077.1 aldehyde dehydrogenase family protein [Planctomycetota bacterium]MDP6939191.1 aldehyde dehydrogenase family protein [Planctomycetota bacterium]
MGEPWKIPVLRFGRDYESLEQADVVAPASGEVLARVSQASPGMVRRDLQKHAQGAADCLRSMEAGELLSICERAGTLFEEADLPVSEAGPAQSPDEFVRCLSATSGLPHSLCRSNMAKIRQALEGMAGVLRGLTRGLDLGVLDSGLVEQDGVELCYASNARLLGAVLPSNSPGVNSIWLPAFALKTPVAVKPGGAEPWTPLRIMRALEAAGLPSEALGYYPTSHEGASAILEGCDRAILFGDAKVAKAHAHSPHVEVHGPGHSKVILGEDEVDNWEQHLDVIAASILDNGGRSCVNASTLCVPRHADAIAEALAQRMIDVVPCAPDDPEARLSAFADPAVAAWCNQTLDDGLAVGQAEDVTARLRGTPRLMELDGATYLQPTLVRAPGLDHPLGNTEMMFPFCSVVEVSESEVVQAMGHSLVVTAITRSPVLTDELLACSSIDRLNLGSAPTTRIDWEQPHEGNLFESLYTRRAIHRQADW